MVADGKPGAFFSADDNLVRLDQFSDVLETDRRLIEFDVMVLGQGVDEVGRRYRLPYSILPSAALHQVIEEQSNDVIRLKEGAVLVHNAKPVGVSVRRDADVGFGLAHRFAKVVEQMVVGFGGVSAKQHVAVIVDTGDFHSGLTEQ